MLAPQWFSRAAVVATAGSCLCLAACGDTPFATPTPLPHTTTGSAIDLNQLDCPSPTVKAIVTAIRVTIGRPSDLNALEIVCLGRESGRDVILQIKTVYQQPQNAPGLLMIGPDSAGSLAQLQASSTSTGGFTSVSGVGDNAASFIETVSGRRAVTLYVQRGGTEFHISMEFALPDSVLQRDERTLALALLPQIRSAPVPGRASVNPQDLGAFYAGDYAASLVTPAEIAAVLGRPVLPLRSNGGRASYQPGIGVSNATSLAKDGSITFELQVYRGTSAAVARAFLTGFWEVPTTTPNPALAGLGDAAFLDVTGNRLVVLSGRELASISVGGPTMPRDTSLVMEKALAAILVPRLLH